MRSPTSPTALPAPVRGIAATKGRLLFLQTQYSCPHLSCLPYAFSLHLLLLSLPPSCSGGWVAPIAPPFHPSFRRARLSFFLLRPRCTAPFPESRILISIFITCSRIDLCRGPYPRFNRQPLRPHCCGYAYASNSEERQVHAYAGNRCMSTRASGLLNLQEVALPTPLLCAGGDARASTGRRCLPPHISQL